MMALAVQCMGAPDDVCTEKREDEVKPVAQRAQPERLPRQRMAMERLSIGSREEALGSFMVEAS